MTQRCKTFAAVNNNDLGAAVREATDAANEWLDQTGYRVLSVLPSTTAITCVLTVTYDDEPAQVSPDMQALLLFLARAIDGRALPASDVPALMEPAEGALGGL